VVPGVLLRHFGWNVMVIALLVVIVCAGFALRGIGPGSASP
jgi:hypothetical protein